MGLSTPLNEDEVRYHGLMKIWYRDTAMMSFGYERHAAFNEVLALKDKLPLVDMLLRDLGDYCHLCFRVLWTIVPNPPEIPEEHRGRVSKMMDIWINWGIDNGYLKNWRKSKV
jgi:hypothetical protein